MSKYDVVIDRGVKKYTVEAEDANTAYAMAKRFYEHDPSNDLTHVNRGNFVAEDDIKHLDLLISEVLDYLPDNPSMSDKSVIASLKSCRDILEAWLVDKKFNDTEEDPVYQNKAAFVRELGMLCKKYSVSQVTELSYDRDGFRETVTIHNGNGVNKVNVDGDSELGIMADVLKQIY